jgi:hypothetical protein
MIVVVMIVVVMIVVVMIVVVAEILKDSSRNMYLRNLAYNPVE